MTPASALTALAWAAQQYAAKKAAFRIEWTRIHDAMTEHEWAAWTAEGRPDERYRLALDAYCEATNRYNEAGLQYARACADVFTPLALVQR